MNNRAFDRWFGNSKIVDDAGQPQVLYHGTTGDVTAFDLGFSGSDGVRYSVPAIFATSDRALASDYAANKLDREIADAMRALQYHKSTSPGDYGPHYESHYQSLRAAFAHVRAEGRPEIGGGANVLPVFMSLQNPLRVEGGGRGFMDVIPEAIKKAVEHCHDGLIINQVVDHASPASNYPAQVFIAFDPANVKSAIGNVGTYDRTNPDIRFSQASPQAGPGSPAFRKWFGESVVVNESGEPKVMYHGTGADTGEVFRGGTFFTEISSIAEIYAKAPTRQVDGAGPNITPVHLRIVNPYVHDDAAEGMSVAWKVMGRRSNMAAAIERLKAQGHDGIIIKNYMDLGGVQDQYVPFESVQVKSVVGRLGEHDLSNANMLYSRLVGQDEAKGYFSTVEDVRSAIANLVQFDLAEMQEALGKIAVCTEADLDPRYSGLVRAKDKHHAQAFHDAVSNTTVFLADRIERGRENAVFLHEMVHRHGRKHVPEGAWSGLVAQVKAWTRRAPDTIEWAIHGAATARAVASQARDAAYDEELFAYAVEEAVARGVRPSAEQSVGDAARWLSEVEATLHTIGEKLLGNSLAELTQQDVVDLAYALAQIESPHSSDLVRDAFHAAFNVEGANERPKPTIQDADDCPQL